MRGPCFTVLAVTFYVIENLMPLLGFFVYVPNSNIFLLDGVLQTFTFQITAAKTMGDLPIAPMAAPIARQEFLSGHELSALMHKVFAQRTWQLLHNQ